MSSVLLKTFYCEPVLHVQNKRTVFCVKDAFGLFVGDLLLGCKYQYCSQVTDKRNTNSQDMVCPVLGVFYSEGCQYMEAPAQ